MCQLRKLCITYFVYARISARCPTNSTLGTDFQPDGCPGVLWMPTFLKKKNVLCFTCCFINCSFEQTLHVQHILDAHFSILAKSLINQSRVEKSFTTEACLLLCKGCTGCPISSVEAQRGLFCGDRSLRDVSAGVK